MQRLLSLVTSDGLRPSLVYDLEFKELNGIELVPARGSAWRVTVSERDGKKIVKAHIGP